MMWGFGGFGMILMMFVVLAVPIGIVMLAAMAARGPGWRGGMHPGCMGPMGGMGAMEDDNAMTIARERFARGEISTEEYDEIVRYLSTGAGPA